MYLLDTDTCVWVLRKREPARSAVRARSPAELAIASMTEAELRFGALKGDSTRNTVATEELIAEIGQVLPFDSAAARRHAELRYAMRSHPIGERDLIIASVAVSNGVTLVTCNTREFQRVPGLQLENWMLP